MLKVGLLMKRYQSWQVVTVRELRAKTVMHCGQMAGKCVEWKVLKVEGEHAIVQVGDTVMKMSSSDIRNGLPMFYSEQCPVCRFITREQPMRSAGESDRLSLLPTLRSADVPSALSVVDNVRKGSGKTGGAGISSRKSYRRKKTADLRDRILAAAKAAGEM
jgi:hypothetical protein